MTLDIAIVLPSISNYNTPYASAPRLSGWLTRLGHRVEQFDFGIELGLRLFSRGGLARMFDAVDPASVTSDVEDIYLDRDRYLRVVDVTIAFLQGREPSLASQIVRGNFLPEGMHLKQFGRNLRGDWYGNWGMVDLARHMATLMLMDLTELVHVSIAPDLRFDSYGEALTLSESSFDAINLALDREPNLIETMLSEIASELLPADIDLVGLTCPFPGQLLPALQLGKWLARERPNAIRVLGGGYPSTELRRLRDPRVFEFVDYVVLDDGELPLKALCEKLEGRPAKLHNTFAREDGEVRWYGDSGESVRFRDLPAPSYTGVDLGRYLQVLHKLNRVGRVQSEGAWLKLTAAHGCYWKKCAFCDVHLQYIGDFDPMSAAGLVDQMDAMHDETGYRGFHLTDEAAPPPLLLGTALELLRRGRTYRFWGNIRYDPGFTIDRCRVLAAAGMVAVTGGIEVASDELLPKMAKGISVPKVVRVLEAFSRAAIATHAYLIYGFPGETRQDTANSLELLRQLMARRLLSSGFYHQFVATAHAPVAHDPELYGIRLTGPSFGGFAEYALQHEVIDPAHQIDELIPPVLQAAMEDFAAGIRLNADVGEILGSRFPSPTVARTYVRDLLAGPAEHAVERAAAKQDRCCWLGGKPNWSRGILSVTTASGAWLHQKAPLWLAENIERCHPSAWGSGPPRLSELEPGGWVEGLRAHGLAIV